MLWTPPGVEGELRLHRRTIIIIIIESCDYTAAESCDYTAGPGVLPKRRSEWSNHRPTMTAQSVLHARLGLPGREDFSRSRHTAADDEVREGGASKTRRAADTFGQSKRKTDRCALNRRGASAGLAFGQCQ